MIDIYMTLESLCKENEGYLKYLKSFSMLKSSIYSEFIMSESENEMMLDLIKGGFLQ